MKSQEQVVKLNDKGNRMLEFKNSGREVLTLDELSSTLTDNTHREVPKHSLVFSDVCNILKENKQDFTVGNIYVSNAGPNAMPGAIPIKEHEEIYGERAVQAYLIRRAVGIIYLNLLSKDFQHPDLGLETIKAAIAISYHQNGLQIAFGADVNLCSNLCIFGGNRISTYAGDKFSYSNILDTIKTWAREAANKFKEYIHMTECMKEVLIDHDRMPTLFGNLHRMAIINNMPTINQKSPLNITEVNQLHRMYLEDTGIGKDEPRFANMTVWDFYNEGTSILKPMNMDQMRLIDSNLEFGKFVTKELIPAELLVN